MAKAQLDHIATGLRALAVPIDSLQTFPDNPRRHNLQVIVDSLVRFGQQTPIVVQASSRYIVAGNGTFTAAQQLGWKHIAALVSELSEEEAQAFLLADNRLSDLAVYDSKALHSLLSDLDAADALEGTGFTRAELNAMMLDAPDGSDGSGDHEGGDGESAGSWDGPELKQVVLTMPIAKAEEFLRWCGQLRTSYGTTSTVATILRAIARQAVKEAPNA